MNKRFNLLILIICSLLWPISLAPSLAAQELPRAKPSELGVSAEGLDKIAPLINGLIKEKKIAGSIVAIAVKGKVIYEQCFGLSDIAAKKPMHKDAILQMYSMSKPIVTVAVLKLVESGSIDLDAPLKMYIPEFSELKVFSEDSESGVEELKRHPTVRDLLRHTAGFTYGFFGNTKVDQQYRRAGVLTRSDSLKVMVQKLSKIPLLYQPGERWVYSVSNDIAGYLVEVVSKKPLDKFLEEEIFAPLDMKDTAFFVPKEKASRIASLYRRGIGGLKLVENSATSRLLEKPEFLSGGGGLLSTSRDYMRFAQMLLNRGSLMNARILKPETVAVMTANQLTGNCYPIGIGFKFPGVGFGLGVSVAVEPLGTSAVREFGWSGAASTHFWVSPEHDLVVLVLTQKRPFSDELQQLLKPVIYAALLKN